MAIQMRNPELVELLRSDYQGRYEPNLGWKTACAQYLALPGLRGFWPMSPVDTGGMAQDLSGHGLDLTLNGDPEFNYDALAPYCEYDGVGDFHSHAHHALLTITGLESYIASAVRGLTLGGWFRFDTVTGNAGLIARWSAAGPNRAFGLIRQATNAQFFTTINGNFSTSSVVLGNVLSIGPWFFCAGRFTPNTSISVFANEGSFTNPSGDASIFPGTDQFQVANYLGNRYLDGRASLCFICCTALSDSIIGQLYQQTRAMFGV